MPMFVSWYRGGSQPCPLCQVLQVFLLLFLACVVSGHKGLCVEPPQWAHCKDCAGDVLSVCMCGELWGWECVYVGGVYVCVCVCVCLMWG